MHSESTKDSVGTESFSGRDILYRENAIGLLDVERAADALLRQGRKPSVAAIRQQLGGGSPNTITPLLAKYWEKLGSRLGDGPESLERVPEALARVTELVWRRALEEARERLKLLQSPDSDVSNAEELQKQVGKLSVALAEARAREGEQLTHLAMLSKERENLRAQSGASWLCRKVRRRCCSSRMRASRLYSRARTKEFSVPARTSPRVRTVGVRPPRLKSNRVSMRRSSAKRKGTKARKSK